MVKVIIFDLQGTLMENGVFPSPLRQVKNILRIEAPFSDFVMRFERVLMTETYSSLRDAFEKVCEEFHVPPRDFVIEKLVGLWNKNKLLSKIYPDTMPVLEDLKSKYKLVLVANMDCFSKELVDRFKLGEYFDTMLFSCDMGMLKSDKGFYDSVLSKYDADPEDILLVGDSIESDINTASAIGVMGVLVDRHNKRDYNPKILTLNELSKYLGE